MNSRRQAKVDKILKWDSKQELITQAQSLVSPRQRVMPETYEKDERGQRLGEVNSILERMFRRVPNKYKDKAWKICLYKMTVHEKYKIGDIYFNLFEVLKDAKDGVFIDTNDDKNLCLPS
jgi:predicted nuclease with TOPRIM domain